jgi:hypothetical protein
MRRANERTKGQEQERKERNKNRKDEGKGTINMQTK